VLLLVDVSHTIGMIIGAGPRVLRVTVDVDRPMYDYLQCDARMPALLWALVAYRGILLSVLAVMSFYVRDLEELFCEAKAVFWSTWVLVFSSVVIVAFTAAADARSSYLFRSLMSCAVGVIVVGSFLVPRLALVSRQRNAVVSYAIPRSANTVEREKTLVQASVVDSSTIPGTVAAATVSSVTL
jgi:hypothetical protein